MTKPLPGAYINFVSAKAASAGLSGRGVATMPLVLDWAPDGVFEVTQDDFAKNALQIFGYEYSSDKLKNLRELFRHASVLYAYNLQTGGAKATSALATAVNAGARGNDLKYAVAGNVDDTSMYDVTLYLDTTEVDKQTVATAADLKDNEFIVWKDDADLAATAGTALTGGTNGSSTGTSYDAYLKAIEEYSFNVMGIPTTDASTLGTVASFVRRMRDDNGVKFQVVAYNYAADYEGVISVANAVKDSDADASSLVYWVTGAEAGCAVQDSLMNTVYDGEYTVDTAYTQTALKKALDAGKFIMHRVGNSVRVLEDINTLVTYTTDKGEVFADNKTIRVCDQLGNDIATLFNEKYIGKIPNNQSGRVSFWNEVVDLHNTLAQLGVIEDFEAEDITIEQGANKNDVVVTDSIRVTGTMERLYMTVKVA